MVARIIGASLFPAHQGCVGKIDDLRCCLTKRKRLPHAADETVPQFTSYPGSGCSMFRGKRSALPVAEPFPPFPLRELILTEQRYADKMFPEWEPKW